MKRCSAKNSRNKPNACDIFWYSKTEKYGVANYSHSFPEESRDSDFLNENQTGCRNPGSQAKYNAANEKIERMSKLIHFILLKVNVPMMTVPIIIKVTSNYYIFDLGEEAFATSNLPYPITWVYSFIYKSETNNFRQQYFSDFDRFQGKRFSIFMLIQDAI